MKTIKKIVLFISALTAFTTVQAAIVTSATFTQITSQELEINMDSNLIQGMRPTDWQIFHQTGGNGNDKVYTQKANVDLLEMSHYTTESTPSTAYRFTWTGGDPHSSYTNKTELGYAGFGNLEVKAKSIAKDSSGIFRLYLDTSRDETFTIETGWGEDKITLDVLANSYGYIDVAYTNTSYNNQYITIKAAGVAESLIGVYATAIAVPEPVAMGIIAFIGFFVLATKRIFNRTSLA